MPAEPNMLRNMIRMRELTKRLGVARPTIYRWIEAGTFPGPINLGDHAMAFYEDEVVEWQKKREVASTRPPADELAAVKPRVSLRRARKQSA